MTRFLFIGLLLATAAPLLWADGPLYKHSDKYINQEFVNAYQDIRTQGGGVEDPLTIGGIIVSTITASSATITALTVGALSGVNLGKVRKITEFDNAGADSTSTTAVWAATNLTSGSYTPLSSVNNLLIFVIHSIRPDWTNTTSVVQCDLRLKRDSTVVRTWTQAALVRTNPAIATSAIVQFPTVGTYVDTVQSASARTYTTEFQNNGAVGSIRINSSTYGSYMVIVEYEP